MRPEDFRRRPAADEPSGRLLATLEAALEYFDADCQRPEWFKIGAAIHTITNGSEIGFKLFDDWSATSVMGKYPGQRRMRYEWQSYDRGPGTVGVGTLRFMLGQRGVDWADLA